LIVRCPMLFSNRLYELALAPTDPFCFFPPPLSLVFFARVPFPVPYFSFKNDFCLSPIGVGQVPPCVSRGGLCFQMTDFFLAFLFYVHLFPRSRTQVEPFFPIAFFFFFFFVKEINRLFSALAFSGLPEVSIKLLFPGPRLNPLRPFLSFLQKRTGLRLFLFPFFCLVLILFSIRFFSGVLLPFFVPSSLFPSWVATGVRRGLSPSPTGDAVG